jgi:hypothetical protein
MVSSSTSISSRLVLLVAGLLVFGCQGSNLTLPADGAPSNLVRVSGEDQRGTVGDVLPKPLVVQLTDGTGRPVPGVTLRFETEIPSAQVEPAIRETDGNGKAAVNVRLGQLEGTQTVHVSLDQDPDLRTTFALTALAKDKGRGDDGGNDNGEDEDEDDDEDNDRGRGNRGGHGGGGGGGDGHDDDDDDD